MIRKISFLFALAGLFGAVQAQNTIKTLSGKELPVNTGMWLPSKVKDMNIDDMKAYGFQLEAENVYSDSELSLKDCIVRLDGGQCSAELISGQGLLLTNHHCGYDHVAEASDVSHDFLKDGFWAKNLSEEIPLEGAFISLLVRMEDVTTQVLGEEKDEQDPTKIAQRIEQIKAKATEGTRYSAEVKGAFADAEYYLYIYDDYQDIRLVGVPPSSIGKYGGDTDNWMWPRHTGDFCMLRIYANKNNEPAEYSKENVPYQPKKFLPISISGVKEDDYAMVMGYPGNTDRYLTSDQIKFALDQTNGDRIQLMGDKLEIMKKYMDKDTKTRIELAGDYASLANYWKYLIGQNTMLKRYDIVGKKKQEEKEFIKWANSDGARSEKYGKVLENIAALHKGYNETDQYLSYLQFGILGPKACESGIQLMRVLLSTSNAEEKEKDSKVKAAVEKVKPAVMKNFEAFFPEVDKEILIKQLTSFTTKVPKANWPKEISDIFTSKVTKKGKTDAEKIKLWVESAFKTSLLTDQKRAEAFFANPSFKALDADPIVKLVTGSIKVFRESFGGKMAEFNGGMAEYSQAYIKGLREMQPKRKFAPDANSTMRVTYGRVASYMPRDGVFYEYYTTLDGVMEKEIPLDDEFDVPAKLKELWQRKEFGQYAMADGRMPVCFLTTNDITGGNSGSPVINAKGELIGCAFDGNWEAMAGDIHVFTNLNRTIAVDARYVLFVVEKMAGCDWLIKEMEIRK